LEGFDDLLESDSWHRGGAPVPVRPAPPLSFALATVIVMLAVYLPEMAISLALVLVLEKTVFSHIPVVRRWLGLAAA